jgi:thiol-disulfide isomerase/thioredoxin
MSEAYYDKRSEFWKKYWEKAQSYEDYIKNAKPEEREQWLERKERTPELSQEQVKRVEGFNRELKILIYCGAWCGDCSRQIPMILNMAEKAGEKVEVRLIDREISKELQNELRIVGALRVPIVVFLTEDFWELGRFGERLLSHYRTKMYREIGRGEDHGVLTPHALDMEMSDWLDIFERMLIMVRLSPPLRRRHGD